MAPPRLNAADAIEQQLLAALAHQRLGRGGAGRAAADHHHVVGVVGGVSKLIWRLPGGWGWRGPPAMPGRGVKGTASNPSPRRTALKGAPCRPDNRLRAEYGRATQRLCPRSRLIARQLEALRRPNRRPQLATLPPQRRPTPTTRLWRRTKTFVVSRWVPCHRTTTRHGRLESGPLAFQRVPVADGVLVNRCQRQRHQRGQVPRLRGRWCGGWSGASAWL